MSPERTAGRGAGAPAGPNDTDSQLLSVLHECATAVRNALDDVADWGIAHGGAHAGQHHSDIAADAAAVAMLRDSGFGVLSEETGLHDHDRPLLAVIDPLDGSTNAARGIPWFATSVCLLDSEGARVALVVNQATGARYEAIRGGGARLDGEVITPTGARTLADSIVGLAGYPARHFGWKQFRSLGAAALDICAVASGILDAYVDCTRGIHGPWDYMAAMLVCTEAGAAIGELHGRDLVTRDPNERRGPVAAATPELLDAILVERHKENR